MLSSTLAHFGPVPIRAAIHCGISITMNLEHMMIKIDHDMNPKEIQGMTGGNK